MKRLPDDVERVGRAELNEFIAGDGGLCGDVNDGILKNIS
jgi:hypothetical protein